MTNSSKTCTTDQSPYHKMLEGSWVKAALARPEPAAGDLSMNEDGKPMVYNGFGWAIIESAPPKKVIVSKGDEGETLVHQPGPFGPTAQYDLRGVFEEMDDEQLFVALSQIKERLSGPHRGGQTVTCVKPREGHGVMLWGDCHMPSNHWTLEDAEQMRSRIFRCTYARRPECDCEAAESDDALRERLCNYLNSIGSPIPFSVRYTAGQELDQIADRYYMQRQAAVPLANVPTGPLPAGITAVRLDANEKGVVPARHLIISGEIPLEQDGEKIDIDGVDLSALTTHLPVEDLDISHMKRTIYKDDPEAFQAALLAMCPKGGTHDRIGSGVPGGKTWCKKCDCDLA